MSAIEIKGLSKTYGNTTALSQVNLRFESNKIYGLLGRNGAGKSTLLNAITGRIFPDSGSITLDGSPTLENDAVLGQIYMLSEHTYYPSNMKIREALRVTSTFYPGYDTAYANKLIQSFGLDVSKKVENLSTGYSTIFKLIIALSCGAQYLLLDEPVLGLDANHRDLFYKTLLEKFAEKHFCAVLSTHLVEEVSSLIEEVIIIKNGQIIQNVPRDQLLCQGYSVSGVAAAVDAYTAGQHVLGCDSIGGLKTAYVMGDKLEPVPENLVTSPMDLQRLFIQLTND